MRHIVYECTRIQRYSPILPQQICKNPFRFLHHVTIFCPCRTLSDSTTFIKMVPAIQYPNEAQLCLFLNWFLFSVFFSDFQSSLLTSERGRIHCVCWWSACTYLWEYDTVSSMFDGNILCTQFGLPIMSCQVTHLYSEGYSKHSR